MGGINGTAGIMRLVAFILSAVTFGLSILVYKSSFQMCMISGAIFAGFFWIYLVAFIGMMTGNEVDAETFTNWAIYACVAYFGAGLRATIAFSGSSSNDNDRVIAMICGIVAIAASVLCFLDAYFSGGK